VIRNLPQQGDPLRAEPRARAPTRPDPGEVGARSIQSRRATPSNRKDVPRSRRSRVERGALVADVGKQGRWSTPTSEGHLPGQSLPAFPATVLPGRSDASAPQEGSAKRGRRQTSAAYARSRRQALDPRTINCRVLLRKSIRLDGSSCHRGIWCRIPWAIHPIQRRPGRSFARAAGGGPLLPPTRRRRCEYEHAGRRSEGRDA